LPTNAFPVIKPFYLFIISTLLAFLNPSFQKSASEMAAKSPKYDKIGEIFQLRRSHYDNNF
ncbi:hypothetical protein, partial [Acidaminococcus sp.]|uniref:hypothetical protein n=1 Tax=Acidaminococcus sp. TaxID=1872103 RepID=UPI003AB1D909